VNIFLELSIIILLATSLSFVFYLIKQPFILGYILTGIIVGPQVLDIFRSGGSIDILSKLGVTVLLFIVGLNLKPQVIKEVGKSSLIISVIQVGFTFLVSLLLGKFLGYSLITSLYMGLAFAFSSTIIVLKLIADKNGLDKLYGKISISVLLLQDIAAAFILLILPLLSSGSVSHILFLSLVSLLKLLSITLFFFVIAKILFPLSEGIIGRSQDVLFLFSISWGLGLASIFYISGFSIEIGALVAGVILSTTKYSFEIGSRLKPLRDFFIVIFFIFLGSQVEPGYFSSILIPLVVFLVFVSLGKPLVVFLASNLTGFTKRTGFMAGVNFGQLSEFSLIIAAVGYQSGYLSKETLSLITLVGVISIAISSYLIIHGDSIFTKSSRLLTLLEIRKVPSSFSSTVPDNECDLILFGYNRVGRDFVKAFNRIGLKGMVVDFNPGSIKRLEKEKLSYRYGDAEDPDFLDSLKLGNIKLAVSTIPDYEGNMLLTRKIRSVSKKAIIIVISNYVEETLRLYQEGASYVIMPHYLGAQYATKMISQYNLKGNKYRLAKKRHLKYLKSRS